MMAAMFGLYRCALKAPATSKYQPALVQALNHDHAEENPLCAELFPVETFPYLARYEYSGYNSERREPSNPLRVRWRDMVDAGLLRENEQVDLDLRPVGRNYELTPKGRGLYSQRTLPSGQTRAQFCLGKLAVKDLAVVGTPTYSIEGLNVSARFTMKVIDASPALYDGTATALDIKVPTRNPQGEIVLPEAVATFVLQRDTDKVLHWDVR